MKNYLFIFLLFFTVVGAFSQNNKLNCSKIGNNQIVSADSIPGMLFTITPPTGEGGTFTYQWQMSSDSTTWMNIVGAVTSSYQPGALKHTTYFRCLVADNKSVCVTNDVSISIKSK